jgi:hypothetical protein
MANEVIFDKWRDEDWYGWFGRRSFPRVVLLTGSRAWTDKDVLFDIFDPWPRQTQFIHGGAKGLDSLAHSALLHLGFVKPHVVRPEYDLWKEKIGTWGYKRAPRERNILMLDGRTTHEGTVHNNLIPEMVLAFFMGYDETGGTGHCVKEARKRSIPVKKYIHP